MRDIFNERINKNKQKAISILEILIILAIVAVMLGAMVPIMTSFTEQRQLETAAVTLLGDLRQTYQFSRTQRDGYKYYGLRFYNNLGEGGDRFGYKIIRYEPPDGTPPQDYMPPVTLANFSVIKGPDPVDNHELLENTFFGPRVVIDASSEFHVGVVEDIIFTPEGAATYDGLKLLTPSNDEIVLSVNGNTKTITIQPLTGNIRIQ
ncbi:MAG: hypothetical protein ABH952_06045 [Candidatus Omnitrophota bacterium]